MMRCRRNTMIVCTVFLWATVTVTTVPADGPQRSVTFWHGMSSGRLDAFRAIFLDPFTETYPSWRVVDTFVGRVGIGLRQKLLTAGELPDLAMVDRDDIPYLADAGRIYPLDELLAGDITDLGLDEALIRWLTYRDHLWGVPFSANTRVLFYNPQLIEEAGLTGIPTTWDELTEFATQATRDTDADGTPDLWGLHLGDTATTLRDLYFQAGGRIDLSPSAEEPVTRAAFVKAVSFMDGLRFRRELIHGEHRADPLLGGFESGIVAMEIDRIERAYSIASSGLPVTVAALPAGTTSATGFTDTRVLVVGRRPRSDPTGARSFLEFFLDADPYTEWARYSGWIPPSRSIRASEPYRELAASRPWVDTAASTINSVRFIPLERGSETVEAALRRQTSRVHERLAASTSEGLAALHRTVAAVALRNAARPDSTALPDIRFVPSAAKLRPGDDWRQHACQTITLDMARSETESFQAVLTARDEPVDITAVRVSLPHTRRGTQMSPCTIDVFEQIDIEIDQPLAAAEPGRYPDPLVPLEGTKTVRADAPLRLWVRVHAGDGVLPGPYESSLDVTTGDGRVMRVPWTVRVHAVRLPTTPRLPATIGLNYGRIESRFDLTPGTPEWRRVADRYYKFLLSYRLTPFRPPVEAGLPGSRPYLDDPRVSAFLFPYEDNEEKVRSVAKTLREWDLDDKAFFYVEDEPFHAMYPHIIESGLIARQAAPGFKYLITTPPTPDLEGLVDIWCLHVGFRPISTPSSVDEIQAAVWETEQARGRGERIWWYTAGAVTPLPTLHIEDDGVAPRVMPWLEPLYGVTGFLHWEAVNWVNADPYTDPYVPPFGNGEGVLVYPPRDNDSTDPVPSIRLELLRDGLEDSELLETLRRSIDAVKTQLPAQDWDYTGADRVREYATRFIRRDAREAASRRWMFLMTEIDRDPTRFDTMRRRLFAEIDAVGTLPLALVATHPAEGVYTTEPTAAIEVVAEPDTSVSVNGRLLRHKRAGPVRTTIPLQPGPNPVRIDIENAARPHHYTPTARPEPRPDRHRKRRPPQNRHPHPVPHRLRRCREQRLV